jgi:hypothetical protein
VRAERNSLKAFALASHPDFRLKIKKLTAKEEK